MHVIVFLTYGKSLAHWKEAGILTREIAIYQKLAEFGVEFTLVTYGNESDLGILDNESGINVFPIYAVKKQGSSQLANFFMSLLLPFTIREQINSAAIIKTNQMWGSWVLLLIKWFYGKKILVRCGYELYANSIEQGIPFSRKWFLYLLSFISYKYADNIMLSAKSMKNFVASKFKIDTSKIIVCQNVIDTDAFHIKKNITASRNRVLFVGRLSKEKNVDLLIRSCKRAKIGLSVVGDGPEKDSLIQLADRLSADVDFTGIVPNNLIPDIINEFRIFALVSNYEGNPKALIEAMACGRAVIGTRVRGIEDVIIERENGILCDLTEESLTEALSFLKNSLENAVKLGKRARSTVLKHNSLTSVAQLELKIYRTLLAYEKNNY